MSLARPRARSIPDNDFAMSSNNLELSEIIMAKLLTVDQRASIATNAASYITALSCSVSDFTAIPAPKPAIVAPAKMKGHVIGADTDTAVSSGTPSTLYVVVVTTVADTLPTRAPVVMAAALPALAKSRLVLLLLDCVLYLLCSVSIFVCKLSSLPRTKLCDVRRPSTWI